MEMPQKWLAGLLLFFASPLWAGPETLEGTQKRLGVPLFIAQVTDAAGLYGRSLPEYIIIQDVHHHTEIQSEIAAMLLHGRRHFSRLAPESLGRLAPPSMALVDWMRRGRISGTQMAALMEPENPLTLIGMEDPELYRQNVAAYHRTGGWRKGALQELRTLRLLKSSLGLDHPALTETQLERLEVLVHLKAKPTEYEAFKNDPPTLASSGALAEAVAGAADFYRLADARSAVFLQKAESEKTQGPKVVVVGGFHTAAMTEALRAKGRSYAVLTPRATRSNHEQLYAERMNETVSALQLR
jgi:hypothetical protein